jgi:hypothetical protein
MSPLRQKGYREDHDQQDSHASEREGAGPLKGNILPLPAANAWPSRSHRSLFLSHGEPLALLLVEIELRDGSGLCGTLARRLHVPEIVRALSQDGDPPVT